MALDWKTAQENEKLFWESIYINKEKDIVYSPQNDEGSLSFTKEVLLRHKIDLKSLEDKKLLDVGSGPYGIIKGLTILEEQTKARILKMVAADPLMDFFKDKIGMLKEDSHISLVKTKGEELPFEDNSFDYIFCTNVLDHCDKPEIVIKECYRVLKKEGMFCPSLHVVYPVWSLIKNYIKYFDKNHPHHLLEKDLSKLLSKYFPTIINTYKINMIKDHSSFTFKNIFKNSNKIRGLKRFLSNYFLYTTYYQAQK
jgi:ubiquinone/menaquinone biosynthesis C-methylase UbiE